MAAPALVAPEGSRSADGSLAVETTALVKEFNGRAAVAGIDLAVPAGATFGFLGPNGSGKTTTIRMLLGLISPTAGSCRLLGRSMPDDAMSVLPSVGALVEGPAFYPWLSGRDNLERIDAMGPHGEPRTRRRRVDEALARVGLSAAATKRYKAYSLGMRQRLGLASALLEPRKLLVLDEPTNGMDPQGTREIRALVRELAAEGTTVFLSSHLLSEIEQMCTHVGVMHKGKLLAQGTLADFLETASPRLRVGCDDPARAGELLRAMGALEVSRRGDDLVVGMGFLSPEEVCRRLVGAGIGVRLLVPEQLSLEEVFVGMTGEGFDVAG